MHKHVTKKLHTYRNVYIYAYIEANGTTSVPKLMSLEPCIWVPFGTYTTKTAEFRFVAGPRCNRTIGVRGLPKKMNFS